MANNIMLNVIFPKGNGDTSAQTGWNTTSWVSGFTEGQPRGPTNFDFVKAVIERYQRALACVGILSLRFAWTVLIGVVVW